VTPLLVVGVLLVIGLTIAMGAAIARRRHNRDDHRDDLEWLLDLRSPSGTRFLPNREAARELFGAIEEIAELTGPARDRPPSV
jgi:hypothetical protein